ncbi:ArnT family glycosyltransferase [Planctomicrobium sp. SH527]|uniref:ArnT family glycosyltransferase n=1 Tax=Planctomicrobium sp. SH527 TaxID=3448123 RepID=UPI003F5B58A0
MSSLTQKMNRLLSQSMLTFLPDRPLSRRDWAVILLGTFIIWSAMLVYYQFRFDLNEPPATSGDETEYDSLGWEIARGNGFQIDFNDPEFRLPYDQAALVDERFVLPAGRVGTIASRPPLFPCVLSTFDLAFGRQFWAARVFNSGCLAISCALFVGVLITRVGVGPAILCFVICLADVRTRLYGRAILTEAFSVLCVTLLAIVLMRHSQRIRIQNVVLIGVIFAMAVLARSLFILWLPGILALLILLSWKVSPEHRVKMALMQTTVFLGVFGILMLPWMVRNCVVLRDFMPLGTQGASQIAAGFGDVAWEHAGHWINLEQTGFYDGVIDRNAPLLDQEKAMADYSQMSAKHWVTENPMKAILLAPMKIWLEVIPRTPTDWVILVLALPGVFLTRRDFFTKVLLVLLAANCVAIGMTWSVEGRFMVPLLAAFHYWAAIGGWVLLAGVWKRISPARSSSVHPA